MKKIFVFILAIFIFAGCNMQDQATQAPQGGMPSLEEFMGKGMMLLSQGQAQQAAAMFEQAAQVYPENIEPSFALAQLYMRIGAFDNAIMSVQKVLELEPQNGYAYLLLAGSYDMKGDPEKAIEFVKMSIAIFRQQDNVENSQQAAELLKKLTEREVEAPVEE